MVHLAFRKILRFLGVLVAFFALSAQAQYSVDKAERSVVRVMCVFHVEKPRPGAKDHILVGTGSGFVIGKDGLVATNDHVASFWREKFKSRVDDHSLTPELYIGHLNKNGTAEIYPATVLWSDHGRDLALIRAPDFKAPALTMNIGEILATDTVYAIGFPGAADVMDDQNAAQAWLDAGRNSHLDSPPDSLKRFLSSTWNQSQVRRLSSSPWSKLVAGEGEGPAIPMIESDCQFSGGNSGGPLLNIAGEVIGVNTAAGPNDHLSSRITVLHEAMGSQYPHSYRTSRPSSVPWLLVAGIGGAALLGITGVVVALRHRRSMGRTTMLGILGEDGRFRTKLKRREEEPPRLPDEGDGSDERSVRWQKTRVERHEPSYDTFELSPKERDGSLLQLDGQRFAKQRGRLILGRSPELAHVCLDDRNVSNRHAAFRIRGNKLYIEDLESSNGTRVNGKRLEPFSDVLISVGDTISLGSLQFRLRQGRESAPT